MATNGNGDGDESRNLTPYQSIANSCEDVRQPDEHDEDDEVDSVHIEEEDELFPPGEHPGDLDVLENPVLPGIPAPVGIPIPAGIPVPVDNPAPVPIPVPAGNPIPQGNPVPVGLHEPVDPPRGVPETPAREQDLDALKASVNRIVGVMDTLLRRFPAPQQETPPVAPQNPRIGGEPSTIYRAPT